MKFCFHRLLACCAFAVCGSPLPVLASDAASPTYYAQASERYLLYHGQVAPQSPVVENRNFLTVAFDERIYRYQRRWASLPQLSLSEGSRLEMGAAHGRVGALRKRLGLPAEGTFDHELAALIRDFRADHGLPAGAFVDNAMVQALNRGAGHYLRLLQLNAERAAALPDNLGDRFIMVDSASQNLHLYEGKRVVATISVIVGRPETPTPMMVGLVRGAVLNPYWNVPDSLFQRTYADRVRDGGAAYLRRTGFEVLSDWSDTARSVPLNEIDWKAIDRGTSKLRLRQLPGPGNGMGKIKFTFPNDFGIYLHDTSSQELFEEQIRAFSAGCVRISDPDRLASWLFGEPPTASSERPEQVVEMSHPVPIYITYFTALPTEDGIEYREDVYSRDPALLASSA